MKYLMTTNGPMARDYFYVNYGLAYMPSHS